MGWKRALWTGCLAPLMGGCLGAYQPHQDHIAEHHVAMSEREIAREINRKAVNAWQTVRCEFPRKVFTAEFRDGFIAGYSDYLDRGGDGQPPAVPPLRYTQNKKYFTAEGHALMRDFLLGFQYGTEVAVATGQRQYLTVPVLIPDGQPHPVSITDPLPVIGGSDAPVKPLPPPTPLPAPKPMTRLPMPRPLGKQPAPQDVSLTDLEKSKFGPSLPPPAVPIPIDLGPLIPPLPDAPKPPPIPLVPKSGLEPKSDVVPAGLKLPLPPSEVRDLPDDVATPPVQFDLPDLKIPVSHPEPVKK